MAKSAIGYQLQNINLGSAIFANADGTTIKDVLTADTDDSILKAIAISSTDTVSRVVNLYLYDGTNNLYIGSFTIPAGAGTNGTEPVFDGLAADWLPIDAAAKKILPLKGSGTAYKLRAGLPVAVASGKVIHVLAVAEDF